MELDVALGAFLETGKEVSGKLDKLSSPKPVHKTIGGSAISVGLGTPSLILIEQNPAAGRIWNILRIGVFGNDGHSPINPNAAVTASITAGAGSRSIGAGVGIYGFDVTLSTVGTAPGTVTITRIAGSTTAQTLTYDINTGQQSLSIRFPQPLGNFIPGAAITVTFSQTSAVGDLTVYTGQASNQQTALVDVYAGTVPDLAPGMGTPSMQDQIETGLIIPQITRYSRHVEWCPAMQQVYGVAYGVPTNQQVILVARVAEYELTAVQSLVL